MSVSVVGFFVLDEYTNKIKMSIENIKNEYFYIGALLNEVKYSQCYLEKGYNNIIDYCEDVFGFKKTFAYDLMKVAERFRDPNGTMFCIIPKYEQYDFSKLCVMASMNDSQLQKCSPEMTVETLKSLKRLSSISVRAEKSEHPEQNEITVENKDLSVKSSNEYDDTVLSEHIYAFVPFFKIYEDEDVEFLKTWFGIDFQKGQSFKIVFYDASTQKNE